jgi:hypothetical protein
VAWAGAAKRLPVEARAGKAAIPCRKWRRWIKFFMAVAECNEHMVSFKLQKNKDKKKGNKFAQALV